MYPAGADSEAIAEEANRASMLASTLEDWLPAYSQTTQDGATTEGLLPMCEHVHTPTVFSGFGVTTVLSVPVAGAIDPAAATSVLAPGETVYASTRSIYVSTATWIDPAAEEASNLDWDQFRAEFRTNIHRFDISNPAEAVYTASGSVRGEIHSQFALSEHAGHLRVVTTSSDRSTASESWVRVLAESDGRLVEVGSVGDIGRASGSSRCASPATSATWSPSARSTRSTPSTSPTPPSPRWSESSRSRGSPVTFTPSATG